MLITPETHPTHETVGQYWGGYSVKHAGTRIYFCDSYDSAIGFWMTNISDASDRTNVSERAIGRTYHKADDMGDYFYIPAWGVRVQKEVGK